MTKYFILVLLLAAVWTTRLLVQGSVRVQELVAPSCRIMGVALVNKKVEPQLNFTEAQKACKLLGLTLASKAQVEAALLSGFETCSYGWVAEQYPVIPRINQNPRCGKNGKGILIWKAKAHQKFRAYCHNSSDIWVNSCIPEIITTADPLLDFETETHTAEFTVSDGTRSASALYSATPAPATTPAPAATSSSRRKKLICITEVFTETSSMPTEIEPTVEHGGTFKNEAAGFGGVPIALLVLALLFFGAAAGLAVCYVKRYVKAFPFTNKNQQKEMIETKVVKEEKADDGNPDEEPKKIDKNPEEPKSPPKTTVRCLEAEV